VNGVTGAHVKPVSLKLRLCCHKHRTTHTHSCTHALRTCTHAWMHACTHTCMHACMHTYTRNSYKLSRTEI